MAVLRTFFLLTAWREGEKQRRKGGRGERFSVCVFLREEREKGNGEGYFNWLAE